MLIFAKNDVSRQSLSLSLATAERFGETCNTRFHAELNGLQTDVERFLVIDFAVRHLSKILKTRNFDDAKKKTFFMFFPQILSKMENAI